jgi:superoxide dismutase, Cu-Zn family
MTAPVALAVDIVVQMKQIDTTGVGALLGKIMITASSTACVSCRTRTACHRGHMVFTCTKTGVCLPGEKDGSVAAGSAAGHHYDPAATGKHEGPNGNGHLGDLPVLAVDERASAISAAITIRLKM